MLTTFHLFRNCGPKIINKVGKRLEHSASHRSAVLPNLPPRVHLASQRSLLLPTQSLEVRVRLVRTTTRRRRLPEPSARSVKHQQPPVLVHLAVAACLDRIVSNSSLPLDSVLSVRHSLRQRLTRLVAVGCLVKTITSPSPLERLVHLVTVIPFSS